MPHKHTRKRDGDDRNFNLAPSSVARPLPAFEGKAKPSRKDEKPTNSKKRKANVSRNYKSDDTPRAFTRLMGWQTGKRQRDGLDDGQRDRKPKKQRTAEEPTSLPTGDPGTLPQKEDLRILPGETMAEFSSRVNQSLPIGGLAHKGKQVEGIKERQTRTEKRLKKMYAEWRVEDARRKEKLEEQQELEEEQADERSAEYGGQDITLPRSKRKRMVGEVDDDDDADPWAVLKTKREKPKGLHDVVQAPPSLKVVPREKFKVRNGAKVQVVDVPTAAGSLKRREELSDARREVIERYRAMMRGGG